MSVAGATAAPVHARDAAASLGITEAELVASRCGEGVIRLAAPIPPILGELGALGEVKTMTRNAWAVLERWGTYGEAELGPHVGQVVGADIDLRVFPTHFASAFAVEERNDKGPRRSLQFFDGAGDSLHKVYLEDPTRLEAFTALVARHRSEDQRRDEVVAPAPTRAPRVADAEIDVAGLRDAWDAMVDTHDFFGLLRRFGVARTQALALAGEERATRVEPAASIAEALGEAASSALRVMLFIPSRGLIQIHTGEIKRVRWDDAWINVLDPRMNLHVRAHGLAEAWVVKKPTADGIVTSLELYDAEGETVLYMFGERKPGKVELPRWREVTAALPRKR